MKSLLFLVAVCELISQCHGVPPTPVDRLWEELDSTKLVMSSIATQLEKFNSLYLVNLEQKVVSVATALANIDSNIKNLQERAHVWDTFQLHVAAWNEQISTLDKKVEIISKGQEKMLVSDGKLNSVSNIEYKVERLLGKQDDNIILLQTVAKLVENQPHDPLFGEFTARGVLSTLKIIERKVDKLQMQFSSSQSMLAKQIVDNKRKTDGEEQKGRLLIKCNTPPKIEEMLSDVASKVDVMFDKFTGSEENPDYSNTEEQKDSSEVSSQESKSDPDMKLIKGLLKRLNQPCKRNMKILETLETSIKTIDNTTITILDETQSSYNDLLNFCQNNDKKIQSVTISTQSISNKLEDFINNISNNLIQEQEFVANQFYQQREHIEKILQSVNATHIITNVIKEDRTSVIPPSTAENAPYVLDSGIFSNKLGCEELDSKDASGIYSFSGDVENSAGRKYSTRYCHKDEKGFWTVIQSRGVNPKEENFSRTWNEYKDGFGTLNEDFWFGNDYIHKLTQERELTLRIDLEDFDGNTAWAEYSLFKVLSEVEKYKLIIGIYNGNASDSFSAHNNSKFSTYDQTNDNAPACCPCSPSYGGGWWFYSCFEANLNGVYYPNPTANEQFRGLIWEHWLGNYSLKKTKMMLRPLITPEVDIGSGFEPGFESTGLDIPEDP